MTKDDNEKPTNHIEMKTLRLNQIFPVMLGMAAFLPLSPIQAQSAAGASAGVAHRIEALEKVVEGLLELNGALQMQVELLEDKLQYMTVAQETINGLAGPHVIFEGCNVHVRSGSGNSVDGTVNLESRESLPDAVPTGLGNLVVGYNEESPYYAVRAGSHNVIVGPWHNFASVGGVVFGQENSAFAPFGSVTGGVRNYVEGYASTVSGGHNNFAFGKHSSVSGGFVNGVWGDAASISGGYYNSAFHDSASVSGGNHNRADGRFSSISGGEFNRATGEHASVSGGKFNRAEGVYASVSGGLDNEAVGPFSSISGGAVNSARGDRSSISGGALNTAQGVFSSISGGYQNTTDGIFSSISGGLQRSALYEHDWVAGSLLEDQ